MSTTTPPTDPSLRAGRKTSEFLLTVTTVLVAVLGSLLVLVDAIAPSVPPKYAAILAAVSAGSSALLVGLYSLGRSLAKASAAASVPAYLESLKPAPLGDVPAGTETTDSGGTPQPPEGDDEAGIDLAVDPADLT